MARGHGHAGQKGLQISRSLSRPLSNIVKPGAEITHGIKAAICAHLSVNGHIQ